MKRRQLLQLGWAGALLLSSGAALTGCGKPPTDPALEASPQGAPIRLTDAHREILAAVAAAVLEGSLPDTDPGGMAMAGHLDAVQQVVAGFGQKARQPLLDLLGLMENGLVRRLVLGVERPWREASTPEVARMLIRLRDSRWPLLRQAYHGLRDLQNAAWFGRPEHWAAMGYPGPRSL